MFAAVKENSVFQAATYNSAKRTRPISMRYLEQTAPLLKGGKKARVEDWNGYVSFTEAYILRFSPRTDCCC